MYVPEDIKHYADYRAWEVAATAADCSIIKTRMQNTDCWAQGRDDRLYYGFYKNGGSGFMKDTGEESMADIEKFYPELK